MLLPNNHPGMESWQFARSKGLFPHPVKPRPAFEDGFEDCSRTITILNIGAMNDEPNHQAERVDDDMTLATLDLLAAV
jgi:hypothetical protein